jgi:hypothetical protein
VRTGGVDTDLAANSALLRFWAAAHVPRQAVNMTALLRSQVLDRQAKLGRAGQAIFRGLSMGAFDLGWL